MITGIADTALHVADVDAAVAWYRDVLGLTVLSPPYLMEGDAIARDMGELLPEPVTVKAAILGVDDGSERVIEVIEYPSVATGPPRPAAVTHLGFTHIGLICDDIVATRAELEAKGVRFIVDGIADVVGVRTTWFADPYANVFILVQKVKRPDRADFRQF